MARMTTDGMDDFIETLNTLGEKTEAAAKRSLYAGADVLADALRAAVLQLPLDNDPKKPRSGPLRVITTQDREDLANCVGLSRMDSNAEGINISASFTGYIGRTEAGYPNGVPAAMIARSIESGSSVRAKRPFIRRTVNGVKASVSQAMQEELDAYINQIQEE